VEVRLPPQQVALHESALYNANVGGGLAPFHYQWRSRQCYDVGGSNCGTWSPYNAIGDGYDRPYSYASINACGLRRNELQVLVTDANNLSASSPVFVITITNPC